MNNRNNSGLKHRPELEKLNFSCVKGSSSSNNSSCTPYGFGTATSSSPIKNPDETQQSSKTFGHKTWTGSPVR